MKVCDYVAKFLKEVGIKEVFVVTGGAACALIDAVARTDGITYVPVQHEQAGAMAVDGYTRVSKKYGAAIVTTGPGVTNLPTGICCLHYDSLPSIFITAQVARYRMKKDLPVRQLGFQEIDSCEFLKPITKHQVLIDDPQMIRYELERALYISQQGRPGPVVVDIPDDVQREDIDEATLKPFTPPQEQEKDLSELNEKVLKTIELINQAKRPVLVYGAGVNIAKQVDQARELANLLQFPLGLTWATTYMYPADHPLNVGSFGISGTRVGNFAVQNADLILSVGSRLDTHATGQPKTFGREAKKIIVDISQGELDKFNKWGMPVDISIAADVKDFFEVIFEHKDKIQPQNLEHWISKIKTWKERFPVCQPEWYHQRGTVNPYVFLDELSKHTSDDEILFVDCGANLIQTFQGYKIRANQQLHSALNNSPMGYSLAGAMGACFANNKKQVICLIGDGGLLVNLQELATVERFNLPLKIFVYNNHGYGIIQQTQEDWYDGRHEASTPTSGLSDPDFNKVAESFGIASATINDHSELQEGIKKVLAHDGPILCNVHFSPSQRIVPFLKFGHPIEDMKPLLDRSVLKENMIIEPLDVEVDGKKRDSL